MNRDELARGVRQAYKGVKNFDEFLSISNAVAESLQTTFNDKTITVKAIASQNFETVCVWCGKTETPIMVFNFK